MKPLVSVVFLAIGAALAAACGTSSTINQSPTPIKCQVALASVPSMDPSGGIGLLAVTTQPECAWDASTSAAWISSLQPASGQGSTEVSFRVAANEGTGNRDGAIVVNGETARVSQRAPCRYDVSPTTQIIGVNGGSGSISIATANECAWTASAEAGWISLVGSASGTGSGRVVFTLPLNSGDGRSGAIIIENQRAAITQSGVNAPPTPPSPAPGCTATISPTAHTIAALGGVDIPVTVSIGATCQWTATSNASWIAITSGAAGTGAGSTTFSVAANTGIERTGTLTIAGRLFTVTQSASVSVPPPPPSASCSYALSPGSAAPPASGAATSIQVTTAAGCTWTTSSSAGWITIDSGASGTGSGAVNVGIAANPGAGRSGAVFIADQTFTVNQAAVATPCTYSIAPTSQNVSAAATSGAVGVTAGGGCAWTAVSNASSWLTITSGASGAGNGSVAYSVAANVGGARSGSLTIAGQTFTVTQAAVAQACSFSVSPTSQRVGPNNGSGTFSVSAGSTCPWTAASNTSWITVTAGASGSGNGSVAFSVVPNTSGDRRTGTLTIAGVTVTVEQNARGNSEEF